MNSSKAWTVGAMVAQGCHATSAAIGKSITEQSTQTFLQDSNMTVCVLGIESELALLDLSAQLSKDMVVHHVWIEQPENIPSALATAPGSKAVLSKYFSSLKLLK